MIIARSFRSYALPLYNRYGFSQAIYDRSGKLLRITLSQDEKFRLWKPLSEISPEVIQTAIEQEDRWFYWHPGINPFSFIRATWENLLSGTKIGASTITMQLARLRYGLYTRSYLGKLKQVLYAFILELSYSKNEILEGYLNLAPYGGNIEGIGAASLIYFGKPALHLSLDEANLLSVIPQDPNGRAPISKKNLEELWNAVDRLKIRLADPSSVKFSPQLSRKDLPNRAPHFVQRLVDTYPFENEIKSTLSLGLQTRLEGQVSRFLDRNRKIGITNASVLLLDYRTMEVVSYMGSGDYFSKEINGAFDGVGGRRSPGSALKPFIYGAALEKGIIHPQSLLKDTLYTKTTYNPENFDKEFVGPITATDALIHSRNVPAVDLLNLITPEYFYDFLRNAHIQQMKKPDFYGLSLALGGVEVRLDELVTLYAMLANRGIWYPIRLNTNSKNVRTKFEPHRLLSPESSFLTLEMLRSNPRPSFDLGQAILAKQIPWKTGTSFGFRDAWAVGVVGPYVLGVWIGNFDGKGNPSFVGREAAGPLFFSIADALATDDPLIESPPPSQLNIKKISVCALSGQLPNPSCPHKKETLFIPGVSPIKTCTIHREILIDKGSGLRRCSNIGEGVRKVFEFWPTDLLNLFTEAGLKRNLAPEFEQGCGGMPTISPILIISPEATVEYALEEDQEIAFQATTDAQSRQLFWFLDNSLVGTSKSTDTFFWRSKPGDYKVRVVDEFGDSNETRLKVSNMGAQK